MIGFAVVYYFVAVIVRYWASRRLSPPWENRSIWIAAARENRALRGVHRRVRPAGRVTVT